MLNPGDNLAFDDDGALVPWEDFDWSKVDSGEGDEHDARTKAILSKLRKALADVEHSGVTKGMRLALDFILAGGDPRRRASALAFVSGHGPESLNERSHILGISPSTFHAEVTRAREWLAQQPKTNSLGET